MSNNSNLTQFFLALALLILFAHSFGYLFHRLKLPRVVGEIAGGLLLGPTVFGFFFPRIHAQLFSGFEGETQWLSMVHWLGLVLLMFISGFDIQKSFNRRDRHVILALTLGSTVIPFVAGWTATSMIDFSPYLGPKQNLLALRIIIAIAAAITSIPVLTKIFIDLNIINTRFAKIVLATATFHDVMLWVALAIATGLVSTDSSSISDIVSHLLITMLSWGVALLVMPKVLRAVNGSGWNHLMRSSVVGYMLFICFLFAAVANHLKISVVFGAMMAGIVVGMVPDDFEKEKVHIKEVSVAFFIPLYFAIVGLKLDLVRHGDLVFFLWFLFITTTFQLFGTIAAARIIRQDWLSSFNLGMAMTDRGGPAIVLATFALDLGIINEKLFVTLVLIAIVTSLSAGAWFRFVMAKGLPLLQEREERDLRVESGRYVDRPARRET